MYLRVVTSRRKHGPATGKVKTHMLHSFGRMEEVARSQLRRLGNQCFS